MGIFAYSTWYNFLFKILSYYENKINSNVKNLNNCTIIYY